MQITVTTRYNVYLVDATGAEVEALDSVMRKAVQVDHPYATAPIKHIAPHDREPLDFKIELVGGRTVEPWVPPEPEVPVPEEPVRAFVDPAKLLSKIDADFPF